MEDNSNGNALVAGALIALIFSLIFSSAAISYFCVSKYNQTETSIINFPTGGIIYSQNQDFSGCAFNTSTWFKTLGGKWSNYCGIGMVLEYIDPRYLWTWLILGNEIPATDGTVQNTYIINNSVKSEYVIILRHTGSIDENQIRISNDGFHIPNYVIPTFGLSGSAVAIGDLDFIPYSGASQIENAEIITYYNDKEQTATMYFNSQKVLEVNNLKEDGNLFGIWTHYYGGVGAYSEGFTVVSFNTNNQITLSDESSLLGMVLNYISIMLQVIVWTLPESIFPVTLNIILIKSQLGGIVVCLILIARG